MKLTDQMITHTPECMTRCNMEEYFDHAEAQTVACLLTSDGVLLQGRSWRHAGFSSQITLSSACGPPTGQVVETMSCYAQEETNAHIDSAGLPGYRLRVLGHFFKHCNEEATGIRVMRQNAHASLQRELVCLSVWKHTLGQLVSLILQHENTGSNNRCTTSMQNPVQPFLRKRKFVVETSHARSGPVIIHPHGVFLRRNRTHRGQNVTIEKGC